MTGRDQILHLGKQIYGEKFQLDDTKRLKMYENMYYYFLGQPVPGLDLGKGIALIGNIGVGKSASFRVLQRLFPRYHIANSQDILNHFYKHGVKGIIESYGYDRKIDLCIDDFGIQQDESNHYGNRIEIFQELYSQRVELFLKEGFKFHFTSNCNKDDLKKMLGDRLYDRLRETNNLITWTGESLRS